LSIYTSKRECNETLCECNSHSTPLHCETKMITTVMHTVRQTDPYIELDYGDRYVDCQDALTCAVCVDLMVDLGIHTVQPTARTIVFERSQDITLAVIYLSRYTHFEFTVHEF